MTANRTARATSGFSISVFRCFSCFDSSSAPPAPEGHPLRYSRTPGSHLRNRRAEFREAPLGETSPEFGDSREFVPPGEEVYEMSSKLSNSQTTFSPPLAAAPSHFGTTLCQCDTPVRHIGTLHRCRLTPPISAFATTPLSYAFRCPLARPMHIDLRMLNAGTLLEKEQLYGLSAARAHSHSRLLKVGKVLRPQKTSANFTCCS